MKIEIKDFEAMDEQHILHAVLKRNQNLRTPLFNVYECMMINQNRSLLYAKAFGATDHRANPINARLKKKLNAFVKLHNITPDDV